MNIKINPHQNLIFLIDGKLIKLLFQRKANQIDLSSPSSSTTALPCCTRMCMC